MCIGCSSPDPPAQFLNSKIKIAGYKNEDGTPQQLHMRPVDLYNIFDIDVSKKWKKKTVNSWNLIVNLKQTDAHEKKTLVISITTDISETGSVLIDDVTLNNLPAPGMIAEILKLDAAFNSRGQGNSGRR